MPMTKELSDIPQNQRGPCMSKHPSAGAVLLILCHHTNLQKNQKNRENMFSIKLCQIKKPLQNTGNATKISGTQWEQHDMAKGIFMNKYVEHRWTILNISWLMMHGIFEIYATYAKCQTTGVKKKVRKKHCLLRPKNHWFTAPLLKHA